MGTKVDLLLSQGQSEPKIRNIMMALLIQFLSNNSVKDLPQNKQQSILRSQSPLLENNQFPQTNLLNTQTSLLHSRSPLIPNSAPIPANMFSKSALHRPSPLISSSKPAFPNSVPGLNANQNGFLSTSGSLLSNTGSLVRSHESLLSTPPSTLTTSTPWLSNSTPLSSSLPSESVPAGTPVISLSSILSTPPIRSPDGKSIFIPVDSSMLQGCVSLASPSTTPVISPASTPKKDNLARKLYLNEISPIVTLLDDSKSRLDLAAVTSSPMMTPPEDFNKRTVEAEEMANDNLVQGPTTNVSFEELETASTENGVSSPISSAERDSPVNSLPDTNGVDLNEVLKALSSEEGSTGSQDEVVSKLVTIINDLVENTDITMGDIVEMMKSSVNSTQDQNSSGLATCQSEAPQLMTSSQSQVTSSICQGVDQKMPGILLPANWVQFNLNNVAAPHTNLKFPTVGRPSSSPYHPYKRSQQSPLNTGHSPMSDGLTPGDKKSNVCSTCNTSFSQFSSLLRHIRQVHQKIKDKPCSICGERFARSQYLPNHIWRTHYNRAVTNVKCFFCPEILNTKEGIQQHLWLNHVKARR
ncbi:uncharacterized protein LOC134813579 isoform X2 [Bolinopsis microptera]|uniref:uncharacterized protein LOC134813579 isoform X2 n=1 Tax=Bolinopsis microptera TaxID=2820187 RepID=UPI003079AACF